MDGWCVSGLNSPNPELCDHVLSLGFQRSEVNRFTGGCFWVVAGVHALVKFPHGWAGCVNIF